MSNIINTNNNLIIPHNFSHWYDELWIIQNYIWNNFHQNLLNNQIQILKIMINYDYKVKEIKDKCFGTNVHIKKIIYIKAQKIKINFLSFFIKIKYSKKVGSNVTEIRKTS